MRVVVIEYLHAQSEAFHNSSDSMKSEGRQMLNAILSDALRLDSVETHVPICAAAREMIGTTNPSIIPDGSEFDFPDQLLATISTIRPNVCLIVAPETGGILRQLTQRLRHAGARVVAPELQLISMCGDKLATHQFLQRHRLPTIPSYPLTQFLKIQKNDHSHVVIKPVDGAGSEGIRRMTEAEFQSTWLASVEAGLKTPGHKTTQSGPASPHPEEFLTIPQNFLVQPFIEGRSFSCGVVGLGTESKATVLPIAEQAIEWSDNRPIYKGGLIGPGIDEHIAETIRHTSSRIRDALNLRDGYVGIDFVVDEASGQVYVTEINPRLCTSYVGYQQAADSNLTEALLQAPGFAAPRFRKEAVSFDV